MCASAVACDGTYLYVWDETAGTLIKMGTGYYGTVAGEEIASNQDAKEQLKDAVKVLAAASVGSPSEGGTVTPADVAVASASVDSGTPAVAVEYRFDAHRMASLILLEEDGKLATPGVDGPCDYMAAYIDTPFNCDSEPATGNYFEIEIVSHNSGALAIGFANPDMYQCESGDMPGWHDGSYAYHSDDGIRFGGDSFREGGWDHFDQAGVVIGCGFDSQEKSIFYTRNGTLIGTAFTNVQEATLFPVVGFHGEGLVVRLISSDFRYSLPERTAAVGGQGDSGGPKSASPSTSIACASGKIYVRTQAILGPVNLAVFSCNTLKLENIVPIAFPETLSTTSSSPLLSSTPPALGGGSGALDGPSFVFEYSDNEKVDVRAIAGFSLFVTSAKFNESDFTDIVRQLVDSTGKVLHIEDIVEVLGDVSPGMSKRLVLSVQAVVGEDAHKASGQAKEGYAVYAPMTSDGRNLLFLAQHCTSPADKSASVLFSAVRDIEIKSAYYYDSNNSNGDVSEPVAAKWAEFLNLGHTATYEYSKADNGAFGDTQVGIVKTLWVNYSVRGGNPRTITFAENAAIAWNELLEQAVVEFSGFQNQLEVISVDPLQGMSVSKSCVISAPPSSLNLGTVLTYDTAIVSNGSKLVIQQARSRTSADFQMNVFKFDIKRATCDAAEESVSKCEKGDAIANGFCYDSRNNLVWGWDVSSRSFARWRNVGLAPRFIGPRPYSDDPSTVNRSLMFSPFAAHRLEALNKPDILVSSPKAQAAVLATILDKISEPYGPTSLGSAGESTFDEIELISKFGTGGFSLIKVRGVVYGNGFEPESGVGQGFNIVVLGPDFKVLDVKNFNVAANATDADKMAELIESTEVGQLVLVAANTNSKSNMNRRLTNALKSVGSDVDALNRQNGHEIPFVLVGKKGLAAGAATQKVGQSKGKVALRYNLPSQSYALQVDPSQAAIEGLVAACCDNFGSTDDYDRVVLISVFRLLTVNLYQLQQGRSVEEVNEIFPATLRKKLRDLLVQIIDENPSDPFAETLSSVAVNLFISSLQLLYPTPTDRQALLQEYLSQYSAGKLSKQERSVLELILYQASTPTSVAAIVASSNTTGLTSLLSTLMLILRKEISVNLQAMAARDISQVGSSVSQEKDSLGEASVKLISSLSKMLFSKAAQEIIVAGASAGKPADSEAKSKGGEEKDVTVGTAVTDLRTKERESCASVVGMLGSMLAVSSEVLSGSLPASVALGEGLDPEVDELLKSSLVGALLPTFVCATSLLLDSHGKDVLEWTDDSDVNALYEGLSACSRHLQPLLARLPKDSNQKTRNSAGPVSDTIEKVYESNHPYADNMNERTDISFPGALKIIVTFDPQSRSENGRDYLRFYSPSGTVLHSEPDRFSGRDGSQVREGGTEALG